MKLLLASNNEKKRGELQRILADLDCEIVTPKELGLTLDPEENGATFAENARIKALEFAANTDLIVLADDSGLEVDALDGAPGVRSARYAGRHGDDAANRAHLLSQLEGLEEAARGARFVCAIVVARGDQVLAEVEGTCPGRILAEERGDGGFGYDSLFLDEASGRSFAELSPEDKDAISHRGVALRRLARALTEIGS